MKTAVLLLHGSGGTGIQLRTFLETAPINSLGQRTFREILDAGPIFSIHITAKNIFFTAFMI